MGASPGLDTLGGGRPRGSTSEREALENDHLRVEVDEGGVIRRVLDKTRGREVLPPGGAANLLQLHPDHPVKWDAWDLDRSYRARVTDLTHGDVTVDGDTVVVTHTFGESSARQRIRLVEDRLEVETDIDWHEREKVLKAAFDVDVHTDHAAYETQFGHVVRPTHENTTWDAARFEVCAHRWVHVGEGGYGVGLANDATYGHDVTRHPRDGGGTFSRVRLSLLRAPLFPDPETDQGRHVLRYALVPGAGIAEAAEAGYALNLPLRRRRGSAVEPLVSVEGTAYVEAVKLAEDGSGDLVVRLYEPLGARTSVADQGVVRALVGDGGGPPRTALRLRLLGRRDPPPAALPDRHPPLRAMTLSVVEPGEPLGEPVSRPCGSRPANWAQPQGVVSFPISQSAAGWPPSSRSARTASRSYGTTRCSTDHPSALDVRTA